MREGESQKYQNLRGQMAKYLCLPQDSGKYGQSYLKKIVETNIEGMQPIKQGHLACEPHFSEDTIKATTSRGFKPAVFSKQIQGRW